MITTENARRPRPMSRPARRKRPPIYCNHPAISSYTRAERPIFLTPPRTTKPSERRAIEYYKTDSGLADFVYGVRGNW